MGNQLQVGAAACEPARASYPMTFHLTHSDAIQLSSEDAIAHRTTGFCNGISFGSRPIDRDEKVRVKLLEVGDSWNGSLRFGFTSVNPATTEANKLPRYSCPDLTKHAGYWAIAVPDNHAKKNDVLTFVLNDNGIITYLRNGEDMGRLMCGLPTNTDLWPIIDLYGNTVKAQFLVEDGSSTDLGIDIKTILEDNFQLPNYGCLALENFPFNRHNKGSNIEISNDCNIIKHGKLMNNGNFAFTSDPLPPGSMWVTIVADVDLRWGKNLSFYLTTANPNKFSKVLPAEILSLKREGLWYMQENIFTAPRVGDELALSLDNAGRVHVAINGNAFTQIMVIPVDQPLWVVLDLGCSVRRIKSCGLHRLKGKPLPHIPGFAPVQPKNSQLAAPPTVPKKSETQVNVPPHGDNISEVNSCSICFDNEVNCVLYKCGHLSTCYECAQNMFNRPNPLCPICRNPINDIIRVFRS